MSDRVLGFYEEVAEIYHLMFEDWEQAIARQAKVIDRVLKAEGVTPGTRMLDCACGVGTQALGLAAAGYRVTATDLAPAMVRRARREADQRGLSMDVSVADMRCLGDVAGEAFGAVIAMDNALPHLQGEDLGLALGWIAQKLKPGGVFLASIRDYDTLIDERPAILPPAFYGEHGRRRIVHQVWDWVDERTYRFHLYITCERVEEWTSHHTDGIYHCVLRSELSAMIVNAGFSESRWMMPEESGFYQPVLVARR